ncbi:5-formyltetrahydrofolate cyclo-ligase [Staphylococcus warneri]|uniref:5-formyltetrahydrofolate cyclo-ligase n=1 Tax=Staphylococcus warneri TaxID=1292 RepID=UPI002042293B|nr:5-formyltetrahydrofolate cyclo-ligase [Staphylococcus warneri]MCM3318521.1 5-formyltetrahydrofolate cyclo-ligase [Staphylococcus warneri]
MNKKDIRSSILTTMKKHSNTEKNIADDWLANQFFNSKSYQEATSIGIVLSLPHEVNTYIIIQQSLKDHKKIFVPEVDYKSKLMTFKQLLDLNEIERDAKGIYHSISNTQTTDQLDLVVVPGVGFKSDGYRIGYGGGFYDRFISNFNPKTISLLYDFQLIDFEPDKHDQPVDELIIYKSRKWRQK